MHDAEPGSPDAQASATMPPIVWIGEVKLSSGGEIPQKFGAVDDAYISSKLVVARSVHDPVQIEQVRHLRIRVEAVCPSR